MIASAYLRHLFRNGWHVECELMLEAPYEQEEASKVLQAVERSLEGSGWTANLSVFRFNWIHNVLSRNGPHYTPVSYYKIVITRS